MHASPATPALPCSLWVCALLLLAALLSACDASSSTAPTLPATPFVCNPTKPGNTAPAGQTPGHWYTEGNGLWSDLWPEGVTTIGGPEGGDVATDGTLSIKWPWWRDVSGQLTISGRRLGGEPGQLTASVPSGYGPTGFQVSSISFSAEGCWEVTGEAGGARVVFVVEVVRGRRP